MREKLALALVLSSFISLFILLNSQTDETRRLCESKINRDNSA